MLQIGNLDDPQPTLGGFGLDRNSVGLVLPMEIVVWRGFLFCLFFFFLAARIFCLGIAILRDKTVFCLFVLSVFRNEVAVLLHYLS